MDYEYAKERLLQVAKGEGKIYARVITSKSGMSRKIRYFACVGGQLHPVTQAIAELSNAGKMKDGWLVVKGCGMDFVWNTLHEAYPALFPDEGAYGKSEEGRKAYHNLTTRTNIE